ncbi:MAG: tetratricopeptide repeat protein [Ferruginibacter sp.]
MKKIIFCLSMFCFLTKLHSQHIPDDVLKKYSLAKTDAEKGSFLFDSTFTSASGADSNTINLALEFYATFEKENDEAGVDYMELFFANVMAFKGDFSSAIDQAISILPRFEKRKDKYGIMVSNHVIGLSFLISKNYEQGLNYFKKSKSIAEDIHAQKWLASLYNNIGVAYAFSSMPDSGLLYAQKAVALDTKMKNDLGPSVGTLAENYMAAGDYDIAIPLLRKSMYHILQTDARNDFNMAYGNNDFAQAFLATKQYDSANYYARQSIELSAPLGFYEQTMRSYEYLYKSYTETKQQDSVNKYVLLTMNAKDSLFSTAKTRSIEAASFREQLRQQESETERIKEEAERRENIQYALIAFGIISFFILFLMYSRSVIANEKLISFFSIVALLIVFEFLNLLLHPFLERVTHHSPILMLLSLVCIAALLVPLHHKLEHWATHKLIEKNKGIRLAAAKKTIEKLESGS